MRCAWIWVISPPMKHGLSVEIEPYYMGSQEGHHLSLLSNDVECRDISDPCQRCPRYPECDRNGVSNLISDIIFLSNHQSKSFISRTLSWCKYVKFGINSFNITPARFLLRGLIIQFLYLSSCQQQARCNRRTQSVYTKLKTGLRIKL